MKYKYKHSNIQYDSDGNVKSFEVTKEQQLDNSLAKSIKTYHSALSKLNKYNQCKMNAAVYLWSFLIMGTIMLPFPSIWGSLICYICGAAGFIYWKIMQTRFKDVSK
jgi:hypothetical protein